MLETSTIAAGSGVPIRRAGVNPPIGTSHEERDMSLTVAAGIGLMDVPSGRPQGSGVGWICASKAASIRSGKATGW